MPPRTRNRRKDAVKVVNESDSQTQHRNHITDTETEHEERMPLSQQSNNHETRVSVEKTERPSRKAEKRMSGKKKENSKEEKRRSSAQSNRRKTLIDIKKEHTTGNNARKSSEKQTRRSSSRTRKSTSTVGSGRYSTDEENDLSLAIDAMERGVAYRKRPRTSRGQESTDQQQEDLHADSPDVLVQPSKGDPDKSPVRV